MFNASSRYYWKRSGPKPGSFFIVNLFVDRFERKRTRRARPDAARDLPFRQPVEAEVGFRHRVPSKVSMLHADGQASVHDAQPTHLYLAPQDDPAFHLFHRLVRAGGGAGRLVALQTMQRKLRVPVDPGMGKERLDKVPVRAGGGAALAAAAEVKIKIKPLTVKSLAGTAESTLTSVISLIIFPHHGSNGTRKIFRRGGYSRNG